MHEVSEIQLVPCKPNNGLVGFCSFILDGSFYCGDISIYSRLDGSGFRLVYPCKILKNGIRIQVFHPISREAASSIEKPVLDAFERLIINDNERITHDEF